MNNDQRAKADHEFTELRARIGDRQLLVGLIRRDISALRRMDAEPAPAHAAAGFLGGADIDYRALAVDRLQQRLAYLDRLPRDPDANVNEDDVRTVAARFLQ